MVLNDNLFYWRESLSHKEPVIDPAYIYDVIVIEDQSLLERINNLRELIISYCVLIRKDRRLAEPILDEIMEVVNSGNNIQYSEFIAYWKTLDLSYSIFQDLPFKRTMLQEILDRYCERRKRLYERLGYTNTTIQALYDEASWRKRPIVTVDKIITLLPPNYRSLSINLIIPSSLTDSKFKDLINKNNIQYNFEKHYKKPPNIIIFMDDHIFLIDAKHIKETGGSQTKQIQELIEFISSSERNKNIHYVSFLDGLYFNLFSHDGINGRILSQRTEIENALKANPSNFFVNTYGFKLLFSKKIT